MEEIRVGQKVKCNAVRSLLGKKIDTTRPYEVEMLHTNIGRAYIYAGYEGFNVTIEDLEPWQDTPEAILRLHIEKLTEEFDELRAEADRHAEKVDFHRSRYNDLAFKSNELGAEIARKLNEQTKLSSMNNQERELFTLEQRARANGSGLRYIEQDGATVALIVEAVTGSIIGRGVARCSTEDKYNRTTGKIVALHKALGDHFDATEYGERKNDIAPGLGFSLSDLRTVSRIIGEGGY